MKYFILIVCFTAMSSIALTFEPIGGASMEQGLFGSQSWSSPYSAGFINPESSYSYPNINENDAFSLESYRSIDYWDTPALIQSPNQGGQSNPSDVWLWSTPPLK